MNTPGWMLCLLAAAPLAAAALPPPSLQAFVPRDDDAVVQVLPYRLDATARTPLARASATPLALNEALAAAQAAIERSRRHGDPRELGAAQALLQPWWAQTSPPAAVRLLRATVLQGQHQFAAALTDLDAVLAPPTPSSTPSSTLSPTHSSTQAPVAVQAQALLTRASVHQVLGALGAAQADCQRLTQPPFHSLNAEVALTARACLAELNSLGGQGREAQRRLAGLAHSAGPSPWLALLQAELAERLGDAAAGALYAQALQGGSVYARAAYADWLLQQGRPAQALALLPAEQAQADALLLRRAIALKQVNAADAGDAARQLAARFAAARERGPQNHAREEARFLLDVQGQPLPALALAQRNWQQQKEPADALLLARTALAAEQRQALAPLQKFVREHRWEDARLARLDRSLQP